MWIVDMIVTSIVQFHSWDPSGVFSFVIMLFFFPFAIGVLVWINYRSETLMFASVAIGFVLSMLIFLILHSALGSA